MKFRLVESIESDDAENIINDEFWNLWTRYKRQVNRKKRIISTTNVSAHIYQKEGELWFEITYKKLPEKIIKELKATWAEELSRQFGLYWAEPDASKKVQKFMVNLENINGDRIRAIIQQPLHIQEYINSIKREGKA